MSLEPQPTSDDRIIAGIAHLAVIVPLGEVLAPLFIWVTQKGRSPYLRFQALQSLIFQLIKIGCLFLGMALYMLLFFGMFFLMFLGGAAGAMSDAESASPLFPLLFLIPFALMILSILISGLVQFACLIYGIVGGIMTWMGKDFRYVWIGNFLYRKLTPAHEPLV